MTLTGLHNGWSEQWLKQDIFMKPFVLERVLPLIKLDILASICYCLSRNYSSSVSGVLIPFNAISK